MRRLLRPLFAAALCTAVGLAVACAPVRTAAPVAKACSCHCCGCNDCVKDGKPCNCPKCPGTCVAVTGEAKAKKPCCGEKPCSK